MVGMMEGAIEGTTLGFTLGATLGAAVVGATVGAIDNVGATVGDTVGVVTKIDLTLFPLASATYTAPDEVRYMPSGFLNVAEVAAPPSPVLAVVPVPARVVSSPVIPSMMKTRLPEYAHT